MFRNLVVSPFGLSSLGPGRQFVARVAADQSCSTTQTAGRAYIQNSSASMTTARRTIVRPLLHHVHHEEHTIAFMLAGHVIKIRRPAADIRSYRFLPSSLSAFLTIISRHLSSACNGQDERTASSWSTLPRSPQFAQHAISWNSASLGPSTCD